LITMNTVVVARPANTAAIGRFTNITITSVGIVFMKFIELPE